MGRPTSIRTGGGGAFNHGYTYDNVGNVLTNTDVNLGQTQNYQYDHRDRLIRAWTTGSATASYDHTFGYNPLGNITSKPTLTNTPDTFTYNPSGAGSVRPHAVTQRGADTYAYDNNGNMTSRAGRALVWNADNTLASMVGPDGVPEGYTYDPAGNRLTRARNLGQPGGVTVVTLAGGLWEEDVPTGDTRANYRFAGRAVAMRAVSGGTATVTYLHGDHLGSVSATSNGAGHLSGQQLFDPYGRVRAGNALPTTLGFTGQRQDGTGLMYYGARYYDPTLGRFASADSVVPGMAEGKAARGILAVGRAMSQVTAYMEVSRKWRSSLRSNQCR